MAMNSHQSTSKRIVHGALSGILWSLSSDSNRYTRFWITFALPLSYQDMVPGWPPATTRDPDGCFYDSTLRLSTISYYNIFTV